jgi:hypothetical protein
MAGSKKASEGFGGFFFGVKLFSEDPEIIPFWNERLG